MQKLLTTLLGVFLCLSALAQEAAPAAAPAAAEKCFPSGSSLIRAEMSTTGNYVLVGNVLGLSKIFDTRTLQLAGASREWKWEDIAAYFPKPKEPTPVYTLHLKNPSADQYAPQLYQIQDGQGKVVAERQTKGQLDHYFDGVTGALLIWEKGYDTYLIRPGQKPKRIMQRLSIVDAYPYASPNHRFLVMAAGHVVDVEKGEATRLVFPGDAFERRAVVFNQAGTEFTAGIWGEGLATYNLETRALVRQTPIPADLPRLKGFEVLPAPNGQDFLYWLNFYNKQASGGLAYWVHAGKGTSLCDPLWTKEQDANFAELVKEALARLEREAQAAAEAAEQARLNPPPPTPTAPAPRTLVRCTTCNGRGTVTVTESQPVQFYKNDKVDAYGQSRQVLVGQGASTTTSRVRCGRCSGTGQMRL